MSRHIHILGVCGTFMGGIALLARRAGYRVTGSDQNTYPPMSTLLESEGIELHEGYDPAHLDPAPDLGPLSVAVPVRGLVLLGHAPVGFPGAYPDHGHYRREDRDARPAHLRNPPVEDRLGLRTGNR